MEVTGSITSGNTDDADTDESNSRYRSRSVSPSGDEVQFTSQSEHRGEGARSEDHSPLDTDEYANEHPVSKKRKWKEKAKDKKRKVKEGAMAKMRRFMIRKGLIDPDMSESELENFMEMDSDDEDLENRSGHVDGKGKCNKKIKRKSSPPRGKNPHQEVVITSPSETTIYREAVPCRENLEGPNFVENQFGESSSEERAIDTSGSSINKPDHDNIEYISDTRKSRSKEWKQGHCHHRHRRSRSRSRTESQSSFSWSRSPHSRCRRGSGDRGKHRRRTPSYDGDLDPTHMGHPLVESAWTQRHLEQERAEQVIREAEKAKARMFDISGKDKLDGLNELMHSVMVDETYKVIGAHVDEATRGKIQSFAYVDLARLLPRDRIVEEEDNHLTWVQRNGQSCLVPATECESNSGNGVISSYSKWHLAFRIYSEILTAKFPYKASELIQYEHVIYMASQTYSWQNVYMYDKDFRIHISKNPLRTWTVILQLAWNMRLKDKISGDRTYFKGNNGSATKKEPCRCFQHGRCNYGLNCKFEHRCTICTKFGHGTYMCRRRMDRTNSSFIDDRDDRRDGRDHKHDRSDRYHYYKSDSKTDHQDNKKKKSK